MSLQIQDTELNNEPDIQLNVERSMDQQACSLEEQRDHIINEPIDLALEELSDARNDTINTAFNVLEDERLNCLIDAAQKELEDARQQNIQKCTFNEACKELANSNLAFLSMRDECLTPELRNFLTVFTKNLLMIGNKKEAYNPDNFDPSENPKNPFI